MPNKKITGINILMPKEHLLKIVNYRCDDIHSLRSLPKSISSAIKSIPMPWQPNKQVEVVYNKRTTEVFIKDKYKITEKEFKERFSAIERLS